MKLPSFSNGEILSLKAAFFYGLTSLSMTFLNKAVITSYSFNYPSFIMLTQTLTTIIILWVGKCLSLLDIKSYTLESGFSLICPSVAHAFHSILSLIALKGMNIPMYAALKRCTPLVNLVLSVVILRKSRPSLFIIVSIVSITVGCLLAGIGDYDFDLYTYVMGALSVLAQGLYLTFIQKCHGSKISVPDMLHINSVNTLPIFMAVSGVLREPLEIWEHRNMFSNIGFFASLILLSCVGSLLAYSQFLCTTTCSALTTSLVGVAKSVIQTVLGFFTFGGVRYDPINVLGLSLNMSGGLIYSYVKHKEIKNLYSPLPKTNS